MSDDALGKLRPKAVPSAVRDALTAALTGPANGYAIRSAGETYSSAEQMLSGLGAQRHGGRWNSPRRYPAVYGSSSLALACAETVAVARYYAFDEADLLPRMIRGFDYSLHVVVDLRSFAAPTPWSTSELIREDWRRANAAGVESRTQAIGRICHQLGAEAIIAPSAQAGEQLGFNIVFHPRNLRNESWVKERNKQ